MDILSEILAGARWTGDMMSRRALFGTWGLRFPCARSAAFHAVTQGDCLVRWQGTDLHLQAGDVIFVARGKIHELSSARGVKAVDVEEFGRIGQKAKPGDTPATTLLSIRYEIPTGPMHPLIVDLPDFILIRGKQVAAHHALHSVMQLVSAEIDQGIASDLILQKLADILLYQVLRLHLASETNQRPGWRSALADEKVRAALENLHRRPEHQWTLANLASSVGLSRASLASRFKSALGTTPMHYLVELRIDKGRVALAEPGMTLDAAARRVGYSSAFAYSKAYKRVRGKAPTLDLTGK
ncbi:AraC family transcriptional regulator [Turneriella parva]|uniref:Transcriptional regulator, AraC family n=1 Tax=Turneriella parva (strain ATCC BAA-1111 / DSM 21527 / NCTC 11395 / H) TaxID=869212 RepID=I4B8Y1_TURPD|nr:AraC family transcriptional regulator [Turneriella parva]AFM13738.1 transcriptional regulator, AraC family [Turneriella parva DSM 21527]